MSQFVEIHAQDFRDNEVAMPNEISKLNERLNTIRFGGGDHDKARNLHLSKKKILTRERINTLIDAGSPFLELSALAGHDLYGKEAINDDISEEELGGVDVNCRISGVADHYADNDEYALHFGRNIVSNLNRNKVNNSGEINIQNNYEPPQYDANEIISLIPKDTKQQMDMRLIIACIVDSSKFEFKMYYGQTYALIADFARICGMPIGIIANNNGVLFSESAEKDAHFIGLPSQRKIPFF